MKVSFAVLLACCLVYTGNALCPGDPVCHGQGHCGANDRCICNRGFAGNDCSERLCPSRIAYADIIDTAVTNRQAHYYASCSNAGICDKETGECECFEGYTGAGCDRKSCPNNCNGKGQCVTMGRANSGYTGWDAKKQMVCKCDPGFDGADCSARKCPLGDDPLTTVDSSGVTQQVDEIQTITISDDTGAITAGQFTLKFEDQYGMVHETRVLDITTATAITVKEALESLPNRVIPSVSMTMTGSLAGGTIEYVATFDNKINSGDLPMMMIDTATCSIAGCQPHKGTAMAGAGTVTASVAETTKGTKERVVCSNRGLCITEDGVCQCSAGYTGVACESQTVAT